MNLSLKIMNNELFLYYRGVLYPLALVDYAPNKDGCTIELPSYVTLLDNLHASLAFALGRKGYNRILDGDDEEEDKFYVKMLYEINKLDEMWEASDERNMQKPRNMRLLFQEESLAGND